MSGDVQPRKRKDKKRKKDELGVDEGPRGTAAALGEGDVFMHSPNDHGTGGHWCAKIIFFSLLAVLVTLIGLIILENRGLSELEANSVESRYSGVLEGWLEDAPDDDHHDEHTLELKHHDDDEHEEAEDDLGVEVERLEKEVSDEEALSEESPAADAEDDDKDDEASKEVASDDDEGADDDGDDDDVAEDEEFLEPADIEEDLPVVEQIVAPKGKPLVEVEEEPSTAKPVDTLAEEEEYEKQQEELRKEQEQASHKDGGNSIEDDWPGEPADQYWRQQLDQAEEELRQGEWSAASRRAGAAQLAHHGLQRLSLAGCRLLTEAALDHLARCPNLVRLDLRHVPLVSTQAVIKFAAKSKHNLHVKDVKLVELRKT